MSWFKKPGPTSYMEPDPAPAPPPTPAVLACSFCGKSQKEVRKLIAGPNAYICDECIEISKDLVTTEVEAPPIAVPAANDLDTLLDGHAVGQRAAKRAIVASLRRHLATSAQPGSGIRAPRLLLVGPSGSGKTTLGRAMCSVTPLPSYHADVSRLSESGYVGDDVENLLGMLIERAAYKAELAQRGVLVIDGLEKIERRHPIGASRDISGEGVQRELIRLLDGLDLTVPFQFSRRHPQGEAQHVACKGLFVAAAARLDPMPPRASDRDLRRALAEIGLLPELLARFDRVVALPRPDADALLGILDHPTGPVAEAHRVVAALGGTIHFAPGALRALAEGAAGSADGAWMLRHVVERHLEEVLTAPMPGRAWVVDEARMRGVLQEG